MSAPVRRRRPVLANWDDIKREEKQRTSVFDGIPRSMPSLAYAAKVGAEGVEGRLRLARRRRRVPEDRRGDRRTPRRRSTTRDPTAQRDELGDLLFAVVNVARHLDVDPELALRAATDKFRTRFEGGRAAGDRTRSSICAPADLATLDALWDEVKNT